VTLLRLAGGVLGVTLWFALWALAVRKLSGEDRPLRFRIEVAEAILLAMFAALWFASLGHGGWWVLFTVLGLLIEGPVRLRHRPEELIGISAWRPILLGTLRLVGAGGILSLLL
jgi:hypothetical protein